MQVALTNERRKSLSLSGTDVIVTSEAKSRAARARQGEASTDIKVNKILRALLITSAVGVLFVPFSSGTPEYSKKENKQCVYCHTAIGKPDLNDAGRYYKDHHSLEGYREKP